MWVGCVMGFAGVTSCNDLGDHCAKCEVCVHYFVFLFSVVGLCACHGICVS